MPTSKVTEIGHIWPDIFITGNVPADASDDLHWRARSQCVGQRATGLRRKRRFPPTFLATMRQIAHRLNVSGTPQSVSWIEGERKQAAQEASE